MIEKKLLPTIKTWRSWLRTGKARLIQHGGCEKGKYQSTLYEIEGHIYKEANVAAPDYYYRLLLKE